MTIAAQTTTPNIVNGVNVDDLMALIGGVEAVTQRK